MSRPIYLKIEGAKLNSLSYGNPALLLNIIENTSPYYYFSGRQRFDIVKNNLIPNPFAYRLLYEEREKKTERDGR